MKNEVKGLTVISKKLIKDFGCIDISMGLFSILMGAMRLDMLGMEIDSKSHTLSSLKQTSAFSCAFMNFNLTDDYLTELLTFQNKTK
tara:strand:+ start:39 stop:299 length:261 start_codon:yes stop_codon:yes gene_type:complete